MRNNRNRYNRRRSADGSLWLSFSDLMSALVLIIILILFYVMYQYFEMYETNVAELAQQQEQIELANAELELQRNALDTTRTELEQRRTELDTAQQELEQRRIELETSQNALASTQTELDTTQTNLTETEESLKTAREELETAQAALKEKEAALALQETQLQTAQATLDAQQAQLEEAQTALATQQTQLEEAQTTLATQQTQLEEAQTTLATQQAQLEQLIGIKPKLITDLSNALRQSNIHAGVDTATGAITLEADVLFEYGQYTLKPEGKAEIDRFLPVYLDVLFSDEYRPYLSQIIIEGHTDSSGSYISNLNLSQQRAASVAAYVLADNYTAITSTQRELLRQYTTANGRSFSDPVLNTDGTENMDASRRVVFKFQLIDDQMVARMQALLEDTLQTPSNVAVTAE